MWEFFKWVETPISVPDTAKLSQEYIPKKSSGMIQESQDEKADRKSAEADLNDFFGWDTPSKSWKQETSPSFSPTVSPIGTKENPKALPQISLPKRESAPSPQKTISSHISTGTITQSGWGDQSIRIGK